MEAQLDRTSSIESEPRTLSIDQIQCAREGALHVMNSSSIQEALSIFTQGLEPVVSDSVARHEMETTMDVELQHLDLQGIRDVASAPF